MWRRVSPGGCSTPPRANRSSRSRFGVTRQRGAKLKKRVKCCWNRPRHGRMGRVVSSWQANAHSARFAAVGAAFRYGSSTRSIPVSQPTSRCGTRPTCLRVNLASARAIFTLPPSLRLDPDPRAAAWPSGLPPTLSGSPTNPISRFPSAGPSISLRPLGPWHHQCS